MFHVTYFSCPLSLSSSLFLSLPRSLAVLTLTPGSPWGPGSPCSPLRPCLPGVPSSPGAPGTPGSPYGYQRSSNTMAEHINHLGVL